MSSSDPSRAPVVEHFRFEHMRLEVGARLQLRLRRGGVPVQHFTTLIGYLVDRYVLVAVPFAGDTAVPIFPNEEVEVHAFTGRHVFSFGASVDALYLSPHYYMHLSYPDQVAGSCLRAAMRIAVDLAAQATPAGGAPQEVRLTDVSTIGAALAAAGDLGAEGGRVRMAFGFSPLATERQSRINAEMVIRSVREPAGSAQPARLYGLEFVALDAATQLALQMLVYQMVYERHKGAA